MSLPGNGIFVIKGELSLLITAMRRGSRWSSHSQQDEEMDPLMKALQDLKDVLNNIDDLRLIDPIIYLGPFLEVIRSEDTTGPVTSVALSAVNKFLSYGLIDPTHNTIPMTVHNIADAVTHARFVGTDQSSDGVVLMKILQVLRTLTLAPEGASLTNESLCEIMLSCFKICFETRLSELLRRTAELYLKDMVQLVFMRLPQFPEVFPINVKQLKMRPGAMEQTRSKRKMRSSFKIKQIPDNKVVAVIQKENEQNVTQPMSNVTNTCKGNYATISEESSTGNIVDMQGSISQNTAQSQSYESLQDQQYNKENANDKSEKFLETTTESENKPVELESITCNVQDEDSTSLIKESQTETKKVNEQIEEQGKEYVNTQGVRFTPQVQDEVTSLYPYGLACVKELFRFLISLCSPLDKQNTDLMIHLGLNLLTVAFEVGADSIGNYQCLLTLVKDELCRNLFSLLNTERLAVFAADLQVCFLMFESLRNHLKFQLELYLTKLIELIVNDSTKTFEHKETALDNILQLWRIPGFVTELYLNYDCDMYCTNLFEDLTKFLAKNAYPITSGVYHTHLLSLDALLTVIESIEANCKENTSTKTIETNQNCDNTDFGIEKIDNLIGKNSRQKYSDKVPTKEELMDVKNIKKWLPTGTEYFNQKPKKGIQFLQEHAILKQELDPQEVVLFLRENPGLDKKMIGEYISNRNNLQILEAFVKMFDFTDTRIDEALRQYLEAFRLPGEAPLISLLMEHFAEHWHKCNGEPFANADSAFTLAYAVIMLNVDQHNHNVKKQNNPMTNEDYKKNLKKVNGGNDFDQDMLDEIYSSIKSEEIVMPAEQTGLVKENYLWKVLLRRGNSKDGVYVHVSSGSYDTDLFTLIWGPIVAALSFVYDKTDDVTICKKAIQGFERCAYISSSFGMCQNLDMLILTLCKFTLLHNQPKQNYLTIQFGSNPKAQYALKSVFNLVHEYGDNIREGWSNVFDLILTLYSINLLPKSYVDIEDFIEPSGKITLIYENVQSQKQEAGLLSSIYSYMVSSENLTKNPTQEEQEHTDLAKQCIKELCLDQLVTDSKFLHEESLLEMVKALIELSRGPDTQKSLGYSYNENITVFFLELLIRVVIQNRDRVMSVWQIVRDHLYTLVMNASYCDYQFLLERSVIGVLRLAIRLMRNEEMSPIVVQSLRMLLLLKSTTLYKISRQISYGLFELLKTSAQNIHTSTDWSIIFTLLECVGAGAQPPKPILDENQLEQGTKSEGECPASSEEESLSTDRGYTSDSELTKSPKHASSRPQSPVILPVSYNGSQNSGNTGGWILVGNEGEVQPVVGRTPPANQYNLALNRNLGPHEPSGLIKCCESLTFLVRDVAHITPYNFDDCVHCIRTFVEASLSEAKKPKKSYNRDGRTRRKVSNKRKTTNLHSRRSPASSFSEDEDSDDDSPTGYSQVPLRLLDLMHTLHTRTAQIFRWWAEEGGEITQEVSLWTQGWCPLLQGIARLCCDIRKETRMSAITYLQRALLVHDLQTLSGPEWEDCFHRVLFPLLAQLLNPIVPNNASAMEETRIRAATVLSKVFLHHLTPLLTLSSFANLWITILDFMDKYMHAEKSDLLYEAVPESLKNMLLVMDSAKVFENQQDSMQLWNLTWDRISKFLPNMKDELFKEKNATAKDETIKVVEQPQYPKSTVIVTKQNVENATRSSIILQPPSSQSINSPLFAHLGQMVSTPIGTTAEHKSSCVPQPTQSQSEIATIPTTISLPLPPMSGVSIYQPCVTYNTTNILPPNNSQGHTFPILYNTPQISTGGIPLTNPEDIQVQPVSLYAEYMGNPYNSFVTSPIRNIVTECDNVDEQQSTVITTSNSSNDGTMNSESNNAFQLSNYFTNDTNKIPPGSEMLFGQENLNVFNNTVSDIMTIPVISNTDKQN